MNFRQLEYIQAIQKEGSISGAAKKLFISQSALSQQLIKLEEEIGAPLFERGISPLRPTYLGEQYLAYVRRILFEYEEANRLLQDLENSKKGRLVVGIPPNRSMQILPSLLPKFIAQYPDIELIFREYKSFELDEMILQGDIDFSIMVSPSQSPMISFTPLLKEEIFLAVPENSPLHQKFQNRPMDFNCCKDASFILMKKGHRLHSLAKELFEAYGFEPHVLMETGNVDLARKIVAEGTGVCFTSQMAAILNPLHHPPIYYSIGEKGIFWDLGICYHKDKYITWAMSLFFQYVKKEIEKNGMQSENGCFF